MQVSCENIERYFFTKLLFETGGHSDNVILSENTQQAFRSNSPVCREYGLWRTKRVWAKIT